VFRVSNESDTTRTSATDTTHTGQQGPTLTNCGSSGTQNCAIYDLGPDVLDATFVTCTAMKALGTSASGLYYVTDAGGCDLGIGTIGSPNAPAIVVVEQDGGLPRLLYGMLFVRSNNNTGYIRANGNSEVYGSVVVQGTADISGGLRLVYDDTSIGGPGRKLKETTRLGRVSGSWLDNRRGGF
jgi:hypothetical protein